MVNAADAIANGLAGISGAGWTRRRYDQAMRFSMVVALLAVGAEVLLNFIAARGDEQQVKVITLFNGKDLNGWKVVDQNRKALWSVVEEVELNPRNPKALVATGQPKDKGGVLIAQLKDFQGTNLVTNEQFKDFTLHVEFLLPREGNSGIFLMGLYELQLTDSLGIADDKMEAGDHGSIPFYKKPLTNASLKPGEWQSADIVFHAPRFDGKGKKTAKAKIVKAIFNGKVVQQNLDLPEPTGGGLDAPESPTGPLMLQGNESPVAFRNIRLTPLP